MSENEDENITLNYEDESDPSVLRYEDSGEQDASQVSQSEETVSSETPQAAKPKILVQRVFHQPEKHVVEQKLDYVIADTEEEITKHVYGGLFRNKYYKYSPDSYCQKHAPDLYEHQDETLVKLGDKFDSHESFRLYVDGNAKRWKYYLKCADSHRKNGKEIFVFKCVFARQRSKHATAKGIRKRTFAVPKADCPCRVILKPVPFDAKDLTVIYVCNHHDHPLTDEYFYKLQHGRRIHPSIKAELMDLLSLEVDREVVKKYFESLTGYSMSFTFFQNMLITMKKNKIERQFSLEKLKEMSKKIEKIKEELGMNDEEENVDNDLIMDDSIKKDKASQVAEVFQVLKTVSAPKRIPQKPRTRRSNIQLEPSSSRKRPKKLEELNIAPVISSTSVNNKSRLETRLQELKHDRETLQSIKHLQDSVRCEAESTPWNREDMAQSHRASLGNKAKRPRNSPKQIQINKTVDNEPQAIVIENAPQEVSFVENQDIVYENEVTVMDSTVENCAETIVNCVNIVENEGIDLNDNNVSYCIQYDDGEQNSDQPGQQYVLLLDDVENFDNLPEVQIQATEFATVSIVSENHKQNTSTEAGNNIEPDSNMSVNNTGNSGSQFNTTDQIHVINNSRCDVTPNIEESMVFEVIQTNDKKIIPRKEIVDTVILNRQPKPVRRSNVRHHSQQKSRKTDVISEYLKEKSERHMFDVFREDLEKLEEDECYMIVVNDEEREEIRDQDSMVSFEDYEFQKAICSPNVKNNDTVPYAYEVSVKTENTEGFELEKTEEYDNIKNELKSHNQVNRKIVFEDPITVATQIEESKYVDPYLEKRLQSEKELHELEQDIDRLKKQKLALEQDVEHLTATKDDLIEDITKAARLSRRMYKRR